jgi:hypothetical protein
LVSEDRFREVFRRITAATPDAPAFSDLETHHAKPAAPIRLKPWMAATGAAVLVLVVVGLFGLLGGGGPDLAAPDDATIAYVKLEYSATVNPVCEGGEIVDNGGFDEATIEIWGPNSDDLTLMVTTFPDGSTERSIVEGEPANPEYVWVAGNPEDYPNSTGFRVVRCSGVEGAGVLKAITPDHGATAPFHMMGPPPGFDTWGETFNPLQGPKTTEWNGYDVLLYEMRDDFESGSSAIDLYVSEDGRRVLRFHAEQNFPGIGDAVVDYSVVEVDEVPADSVSFDKAGLTAISQVYELGPVDCPVTIPSQGFTPPEAYPAMPSDPDSVWFGKDELWTALSIDGTYDPRKSVWWSVNFPGGDVEPEPELTVRYTLLNSLRSLTFETTAATNAYTDADGWFIIAGLDTRYSGCWQVTAFYKDASLSYVYYNPDGADPEPVVPDVIGMTVERAGNVLHDAGYEASHSSGIRPEDIVCDQDPAPGVELNPGPISVKLDAAPEGECGSETSLEPNPDFDTYADEIGRLWYATSCPDADVLISGGVEAADGLPLLGQTWLTRINEQLDAFGYEFVTRNGFARVEPVVRNGEVWQEGDDGEIEVSKVNDYMIAATLLDQPCPTTPSFWNGIPVAFVEESGPGPVCPESEPVLSPAQVMVFFDCGNGIEPNPIGFARPLDPGVDRITSTFQQMLAGPTINGRGRGSGSFFGESSADALISAELEETHLVVDFNEEVTVNNASTSTGSQFFLAEMLANAFQFEDVGSVEFQINGSCEAFWEFLQAGPVCNITDRAGWEQMQSQWESG